jgi:hypothetical protein
MLSAKEFLEKRNSLKNLKKKPNKYGAKKCTYNNLSFPSQLERDTYAYLKTQQDGGVIWYIIRQIPFDLPGNSIHKVDFMVVTHGGVNVFFESKGRDLAMGKLKRKQVEELYNINIHVITNPSQIQAILT